MVADELTLSRSGITIKALPRCSGVYRFYDDNGMLLYIGKSVDIRSRVAQHFNEGRKPGRHQRLMSQLHRIDCELTAGEIGALLAENAAIKAEVPLFNRRQRRLRKLWTIMLVESESGFLPQTLHPRAIATSIPLVCMPINTESSRHCRIWRGIMPFACGQWV